MSGNPLTLKIAAPYARALFDFSIEKNIMHQSTADFQNLDVFLNDVSDTFNAGAIRKIHTPVGGQKIESLDELEDGKIYVAAGNEAFVKMKYKTFRIICL